MRHDIPLLFEGVLETATTIGHWRGELWSRATRGEELLQRADQAMYQAKISGKAQFHIYQPSEAQSRGA